MKQDDFIRKNQKLWQEFEDWLKLKELSSKNRKKSKLKTGDQYNNLIYK